MSERADRKARASGKDPTQSGHELTRTVVFAADERPLAPAADATRDICVEVVGGPMDGLRSRVKKPSFTIGRTAGNDLALTVDPMISSSHARIVREGNHYWLEDLGSRNGTYLGDRKLSKRVLIGPGTTFTAGRTELEFMPR